jgi:hypothetical protein
MAFQLTNLRAHVPPGLKGGIPGSQKNLGKPLSALNILKALHNLGKRQL